MIQERCRCIDRWIKKKCVPQSSLGHSWAFLKDKAHVGGLCAWECVGWPWHISVSSVAPATTTLLGLAPPDCGKQFRAPGSNACLAAARTVVLYGHDLHYWNLEFKYREKDRSELNGLENGEGSWRRLQCSVRSQSTNPFILLCNL